MTTAPDSLNSFVTAGMAVLEEMIVKTNQLADLLVAAGSTDLLLHQFRDDAETDDPAVLKYREWFNKISEQILQNQRAIEAHIVAKGYVSTEPIDVAQVTANYKDLLGQARDMKKTLSIFPGSEELLKELPELKVAPGTGRGGSSSAGIPRPRFAKIEYRVAGAEDWIDVFVIKDDKRVTNLTVLAQAISKLGGKEVSVAAKDIQGPLFATAGTQDLTTIIEFVFTAGSVNYEIRVAPKM